MPNVGQGGSIRLDATYQTGAGSLVDPTTPRLDVLDPADTEVLTDAEPTRDATGLYHYDYVVSASAAFGTWRAHWTGVINSVPVAGDDFFEVVPAGSLGFPPSGAGHTLAEWQAHVGELLRDAGVDESLTQVRNVGVVPAIAKYSADRPRELVVEVAGAGSAYLDVPAAWVEGVSSLTSIEYPARQDPPVHLRRHSWQLVRKPTDVTVTQVLLDRAPAVGSYVRLGFTAPWPLPTGTAGADAIDDVAYEAVAALAASFCCTSLAAEASRSRSAAMPTDFSDGRDRSRTLMAAAEMYKGVYDSFVRPDPEDSPSCGSIYTGRP